MTQESSGTRILHIKAFTPFRSERRRFAFAIHSLESLHRTSNARARAVAWSGRRPMARPRPPAWQRRRSVDCTHTVLVGDSVGVGVGTPTPPPRGRGWIGIGSARPVSGVTVRVPHADAATATAHGHASSAGFRDWRNVIYNMDSQC